MKSKFLWKALTGKSCCSNISFHISFHNIFDKHLPLEIETAPYMRKSNPFDRKAEAQRNACNRCDKK